MSPGLILLLAAQAASPAAQAAPVGERIATTATASVRILRPVILDAASLAATVRANPAEAQLRRDAQGTDWIDFT